MINEERPSVLRSDPGMPSSHAQFLFFAIVYAILSLMNWMEMNGFSVAIGAFTIVCGSYLSKWVFAAMFIVVIVWKHDAEVIWVALGTVLNYWFSIALKRMINEERPSVLRSDPGMPSSHAQVLFFAVVYVLLSLMNWMEINGFSVAIGAFTIVCGSYLSWLRVSQGLHTINQVLVGAAIGFLCGMTWFWVWHEFVLEAFISSSSVHKIVAVASIIFCIIYSIRKNVRTFRMGTVLIGFEWMPQIQTARSKGPEGNNSPSIQGR